jgi:8-oxo-dGTP pyrophosphatase MutT (NUDIX family)
MATNRHQLGQWETLSSKVAHENPYYYVKEDQVIRPDGTAGTYYVVSGSDTVVVVALDTEHNVFLIELLRYTIGELSVELPMGALDGDEPLVAAKRELQEETGLVAHQWKKLGVLHPDNGIRNSTTHVFLATQVVQTDSHDQDAEGIIRTMKVPLMDAMRLIHSGEMTDAESVGPLVMAALEIGLLE